MIKIKKPKRFALTNLITRVGGSAKTEVTNKKGLSQSIECDNEELEISKKVKNH
jgi:hypothetical protein